MVEEVQTDGAIGPGIADRDRFPNRRVPDGYLVAFDARPSPRGPAVLAGFGEAAQVAFRAVRDQATCYVIEHQRHTAIPHRVVAESGPGPESSTFWP